LRRLGDENYTFRIAVRLDRECAASLAPSQADVHCDDSVPVTLAVATTLACVISVASAVGPTSTINGPSAYRPFDDSPFKSLSFSYFHLQTFEPGNPATPGHSANNGIVSSPSQFSDSVDADDGVLDGTGANGYA